KEQDAIEKRGIDYFLSVQDKLENTLYFLKEKINLQVLTLNANDTKENLHQKIKDFLQ
ncbi:dTMP kinase, partial [Campylobacter coli]|nr:dTMP kinase [Campylobacter coli]